MHIVCDVREYLYYLREQVSSPKHAVETMLAYFLYREYLLDTRVYYLPSDYARHYGLIGTWMKNDFQLVGEIAFNLQLMPCDIVVRGVDVWIKIERKLSL